MSVWFFGDFRWCVVGSGGGWFGWFVVIFDFFFLIVVIREGGVICGFYFGCDKSCWWVGCFDGKE